METIPQSPQLSEVLVAKRSAMQRAFEKIEEVAGIEARDIKKAEVAKKLIEELRARKPLEGQDAYRMEQALLKLEEYFRLEDELKMRQAEIITILPGAKNRLATNDDTFIASPEEKYNVA